MIQYPHCDPRILHAPTECIFCDSHPDWQELRKTWNMNFTNEQDPTKTQCPAEAARGEAISSWLGNRPTTQKDLDDRELEMEQVRKEFEELRENNK